MNSTLTVAIIGNPNSGKTTIFNNLTGARQKVGNWPGVTVEKKEANIQWNRQTITVVDLPGTYSLSTRSLEELIARNFILQQYPDVIIQVLDGSNLERNLYLTTHLLELNIPLVIAMNMFDEIQRDGIDVNITQLSHLLNSPIIPTVGHKNLGTQELFQAVTAAADKPRSTTNGHYTKYGKDLETEIEHIAALLKAAPTEYRHPRWRAIKLLENDRQAVRDLSEIEKEYREHISNALKDSHTRLNKLYRDDVESVIIARRYGFIRGLLKESVQYPILDRTTLTDKIDRILTNRFLGIPIFLAIMWMLFQVTFVAGQYPMDWIDSGMAMIGQFIEQILPAGILQALLVDGIVSGVGSVIIFLPNILILFLGISILEDTGYMARAAFITDRFMHIIGLHGKSFIPLLMGFGCNVPAILAARTLESRKDRILTIVLTPLMSCSARLAVYIVFAGAFFPRAAGNVIFVLYLTGIILAIAIGRLFRTAFFKKTVSHFVMELPPYRIPTFRSVVLHMWDKGAVYIRKVGTIILAFSIIIWFLSTFPHDRSIAEQYDIRIVQLEQSNITTGADRGQIRELQLQKKNALQEKTFLGYLGHGVQPVIEPLGFDWKMGIALITGFIAKEVVVSTLGVLYHVDTAEDAEGTALTQSLQRTHITPLIALAFMFFILLYTPCVSTLVVIYRETGSWKWLGLCLLYQSILSWTVAFGIYQGGRLLGFA